MTTKTKSKKKLVGNLKPRLHSPFLKGQSRGDEVAALAERIGQPLLAWQKLILDDMCAIDKDSMFVRKTSLLLIARQSGKSHLARMRCLAGLFCFANRRTKCGHDEYLIKKQFASESTGFWSIQKWRWGYFISINDSPW